MKLITEILKFFLNYQKNTTILIKKGIEKDLTFKLPFYVSIIGYDGELKFKSDRFDSLKDIILIVDKMSLRIKENKFVKKSC